jgi:hypothetical protein
MGPAMAERGDVWLERVAGVAGATLGAAMSLMDRRPGGERPQGTPDEDDDDYNPLNEPDEVLPPAIEKAFARLGLTGGGVHERAEGFYAMYRLLKTLGYSDSEIAKLAMQKAGAGVDESLDRVRPSEARAIFETLEEAAVRGATELDTRLSLRGDLVRLVREGTQAARGGREDLLTGLERGLLQGREQLRRALKRLSDEERAE